MPPVVKHPQPMSMPLAKADPMANKNIMINALMMRILPPVSTADEEKIFRNEFQPGKDQGNKVRQRNRKNFIIHYRLYTSSRIKDFFEAAIMKIMPRSILPTTLS